MWVQAGQDESRFWVQTHKSYDTVLAGFRRRLKQESEDRIELAWHSAAMFGAAMNGKLKPLRHYLKKPGQKQTPQEMLAVMRSIQAAKGVKMKITRVPLNRAKGE